MDQKNDICDFSDTLNKKCKDFPPFLENQIIYGRVISIYDGDTITVLVKIDNNYCKWSVRLYELDTCEMKTKDEKLKDLAIKAKLLLYKLITNIEEDLDDSKKMNHFLENNIIIVKLKTYGLDKYGRILASVYKKDDDIEKHKSFSEIIIENKLGYNYDGCTKKDMLSSQ
jgi:endonuclease YncB( thermonuclease family)